MFDNEKNLELIKHISTNILIEEVNIIAHLLCLADPQIDTIVLKTIEKLDYFQEIKNLLNLSNSCIYYVFGSLYRFGLEEFGLQFDLTKAIHFFKRGADINHIESIRALGVIYHKGEDFLVDIDLKQAEFWYKKGETLDDPVCMNNLGLLYLDELPIEKIEQARMLFEKAANLGFSQGMKNYIEISEYFLEYKDRCDYYAQKLAQELNENIDIN